MIAPDDPRPRVVALLAALVLLFAPGCASQNAAPGGNRDATGVVNDGPPPAEDRRPAPLGADLASTASAPDAIVAGDALLGSDGATPGTPPPPSAGLETLTVPGAGQTVTFKTPLAAGEIYLLRASGTVEAGGQKIDAEFRFGTGAPIDEEESGDVGVDIGMKQLQRHVHYTPTPPGPGRMKWAGGYRDDHLYYMTVTGEGQPLTVKVTGGGGSASGAISLSLFALSPAPPALPAPLDTVAIPILKTVVSSIITTEAGRQYLLQASGSGQVGGGGLHLGDAEYMDWDDQGNKRNEGEAGADFGIGVDEIEFARMSGAAYKPRLRWWGPWRKDHTYYQVFTGTGRPIQFLYFDSGYGDNSRTDQLSVKIFAAP